MNKRTVARALSQALGRDMTPASTMWTLPETDIGLPVFTRADLSKFIQPPKSLHPNVGTIGMGLRDELLEELKATPVYPKDFYGLRATTAEPVPTDFDYKELTRLANKMRELRKIEICGVPDELRETFKQSGFTDDELDRMIIYPERCSIRGDVVEVVYKMRDEHGNPPKEPAVPMWRHVRGLL